MQILTSQKLFQKYPGKEAELEALLKKISPNLTILPIVDYMATKQFCNAVTDPEGVLIVGNDDVVPFAQVSNPANDADAIVWSDAPYACTKDSTYLVPDKIVARLPDETLDSDWSYIEKLLTNQANWMTNKGKETGWFHIVAQVWQAIGQYMHDTFKMDELNVSPPSTYQNLDMSQYNKRLAYINLHGTSSNGNYYNQSGNNFAVALTPQEGNFEGNLVFCEACYGAYTIGRNRKMSIPMMALYSGAIGFVGSTTVAYGPSAPPSQSADLLAECFFTRINAGEPVGLAFMNAKIDFSTRTIKQFGSINGAARKTLLQFHLFSVPTIVI